MLFINDVAVIPKTAEKAMAIGGGYAVRVRLHRCERDPDFEPILLLGQFDIVVASDLVDQINRRNGGSWLFHETGNITEAGVLRHMKNRDRVREWKHRRNLERSFSHG